MIYSLLKTRHMSAALIIARDTIQRIECHPPKEGLTRGYFIVNFLEKDTPKKRIIVLPGSGASGAEEYQKASEVLRRNSLIND